LLLLPLLLSRHFARLQLLLYPGFSLGANP
jgi:hypothetical protein